jgi:hypothetical protein
MKQREYALQIRSTGKDVEQSQPWQCAFSSEQRVEMSFTFSQDCESDGDNSDTTCPGRQTPSGCSKDSDIQCKKCGTWFRRIIVVRMMKLSYNLFLRRRVGTLDDQLSYKRILLPVIVKETMTTFLSRREKI